MPKPEASALQEAQSAFSDNAHSLLHFRGETQAEVGRAVRKRGRQVAPKTINNIFEARHPSEIGNFVALAEHFGVPLWVMLIPRLDKSLLQGERLERFVRAVNAYVDCDDEQRLQIEKALEVFARAAKAPRV